MIDATLYLKDNSAYFSAILKVNSQEIVGSLPNFNIYKQYEDWALGNGFERGLVLKEAPSKAESNKKKIEESRKYRDIFNQWLAIPTFQVIRDQLESVQASYGDFNLILQTDITWLWQLPWHLWQPFCDNPKFTVSFTLPTIKPIAKPNLARTKNKVRILAILGDRTKIDITPDLKVLDSLKSEQVEVKFLGLYSSVTRKELYEYLWDEDGWDILFFAGHSNTDWLSSQDGFIRISPTESISILEIQRAMKWAIALGLQIAIFNSCDGVGLAQGLLNLGIPYAIVMSQPVPDQVAGKFVELFFKEFEQGQSLTTSVNNARHQLSQQTESNYPSASWLPIICQNPTAKVLTLSDLLAPTENQSDWQSCCQLLLSLSILERLKKNIFVNQYKGMEVEDIYIPPLLGKLEKVEKEGILTSEYRLTKTSGQEEFLEEVVNSRTNSRGSRVAIIGDPGMGKSIFLQRIGEWIASKMGEIVFFVSLADLKSHQTLEDFLQNQWLTDASEKVKLPFFYIKTQTEMFANKKVWLLLDGADEMLIDYGSPLKQINQYLNASEWISQAKVILTCRANIWESYKQDLSNFDIYQLRDLSYGNRVEPFIFRWFAKNPEVGKKLYAEISQPERIRDLAHNPLQLSLICGVFEQSGQLPRVKAELYQKFIDNIYVWRNEIDDSRKKEINRKLGKLAMRSLSPRKLGRETGNKWIKFVEQYYDKLPAKQQQSVDKVVRLWIWAGLDYQDSPFRISHAIANTVLDQDLPLILELGLLQQVGVSGKYNSQERIYTFLHPVFHAYFAAQRIESDEWNFWFKHDRYYPLHQNGTYQIFDPHWQEVILLWFGREDIPKTSKEDFLEALFEFRDSFNNEQRKYCYGFYHLQAHFLAAKALAEFPDCSKNLAEKIAQEVVDLSYGYYKSDTDCYIPVEPVYARANKILRQTDKQISINLLVQKIEAQPEIRLNPAFTLQEIYSGHPKAVEIFLEEFESLCNQDSDGLDLLYAQECLAESSIDNLEVINKLSELNKSKLLDEVAQSAIAMTLGAIAITQEHKAIEGIDKLLDIHANTYDQYRPYYLGENLEKIVAVNPRTQTYIIQKLVECLENSSRLNHYQREERLMAIAESLLRIAPVNPLGAETLVNIALASNEYHRLSTKVAIERLGKAGKGTLNSEITSFELISNSPKIKTAIAKAINKATANFDPNYTEGDQDLIWDKLLEILEEIAISDDATIEIITKQLEQAEKPYKRMYLAKCLGKIDPENTNAIVALLELGNPNNQLYDSMKERMESDQARCYAVDFLAQIDFNPTRAINILLNLLQEFTERWQSALLESEISDEDLKKGDFYPNYSPLGDFSPLFNMVLRQLAKLGSNNLGVIQALTEFLDVPSPVSWRVDAAYYLATIDMGNSQAIGTLLDVYRSKSWKDSENRIVNLAREYTKSGDRPQILIDAVTELLNDIQDESDKMRYAETLGKMDSGNRNAINALVNILNRTKGMHLSNPRTALVNILQGEGAKSACTEIVSTQRKYLEEMERQDCDRYQEWLEVFFHCAEILTYPEFFKAWHQDIYIFPQPQLRKLIWLLIAPLTNLVALIATYWQQPLLLPLDKLYDLIKFITRKVRKWIY